MLAHSHLSSTSHAKVPLDLFLLRAHALPLTNLDSLSVTFLVHVSPMTYLSMRRSSQEERPERKSIDDCWNLDISLTGIRNYITATPSLHRSVRATLHLAKARS